MKTLRFILAKIFPAPAQSEKMTATERWLLGCILLLGLGALLYFTADWPSWAYWGNYTLKHNFYCPACGGSRAIYHLIRGNFSLAWQNNQVLILSLPLILWGGFSLVRGVITGYPITGKYLHPVLVWGFLAIVILFGILRNIPWELFDYLRPVP